MVQRNSKNSNVRKPDFFIVGAPKCGTTAFYSYLVSHPNIFFPKREDMHFFAKDFSDQWEQVRTIEEYEAYFRKARPQHLAVGERSIYYLYSKIALQRIFEYNKQAKIVIFLRNPIDQICSFHSQMIFMLNEDVENLEQAWHLQKVRRGGKQIQSTCADPQILQYARIASFGKQVERAKNIFPENQIKIILLEDFIESSLDTYKDLLQFLNVPYDGRTEFLKINVRKKLRSRFIAKMVLHQPAFIKTLTTGVKKLFKLEQTGIGVALMKMNTRRLIHQELSPEFRFELIETFREDVTLLSSLLQRDLSHWLSYTVCRKF